MLPGRRVRRRLPRDRVLKAAARPCHVKRLHLMAVLALLLIILERHYAIVSHPDLHVHLLVGGDDVRCARVFPGLTMAGEAAHDAKLDYLLELFLAVITDA